jgi:hypothetical protein
MVCDAHPTFSILMKIAAPAHGLLADLGLWQKNFACTYGNILRGVEFIHPSSHSIATT